MKRVFILILPLIMLVTVVKINAQYLEKKSVSLELAKKIAAAAEIEAVKNKWTDVITIVDEGGNLVYTERMDNTQIGSIEIALKKAQTALYFKRPTKSYEDRVTGGNNAILGLPNVLPIEGGIPLIVDGQFIGAIGVSGGSAPQDGQVAKAGADVLPAK